MNLVNNKKIHFLLENINYLSLIGWSAISIYIIVFVIAHPYSNTITPMYWRASIHWLEGSDLYFRKGFDVNSGFCYFPHAAILSVPFALLPFTVAEVIWRILNITLLICACYTIAKLSNFRPIKVSFFIISAITIAVSYDSIRNGQYNLIITSIFCFVTYLLTKGKYKTCIALCILGGALKPYLFIPMVLLCGVFPKKCIPAAVIGMILFLLFPFCFQNTDYVINQYSTYKVLLAKRNSMGLEEGFANLYGILNIFYFWIGLKMQTLISLLGCVAVYLYCLYYKFHRKNYLNIMILITASSYILLFSSRTEFNTYCFAGPIIGFVIVEALWKKDLRTVILSTICWIIMFSAHAICIAITPNYNSMWLAPLGLAVFLIYSIIYFFPKLESLTPSSKPNEN